MKLLKSPLIGTNAVGHVCGEGSIVPVSEKLVQL